MKNIAIIPARGGSKRLPRKNMLPIMGAPMLTHPIKTAQESSIFDHIIVSTDDDEIARIAENHGAKVIIRPDEMASDEAHESLAYMHVLKVLAKEGYEPDAFCGIYPTAIFITPQDLQESYKLMDSDKNPDVVMSVSSFPVHPYKALQENNNGYLTMVNPVKCKQRSQFYPHYVASNGTFYWLRVNSYKNDPNYYPEKLVSYELPNDRAIDIDTKQDYDWACIVAQTLEKI